MELWLTLKVWRVEEQFFASGFPDTWRSIFDIWQVRLLTWALTVQLCRDLSELEQKNNGGESEDE